jgi:hypothetical protein
MNGRKRNVYRILMGNPKGMRQPERRRWVDNIKTDLRGVGWDGMDWIHLAEDRDQWRALVNTVMNIRVPWNIRKFLCSCTIAAPQKGLSSMKLVKTK